jgi:hypothetical protein
MVADEGYEGVGMSHVVLDQRGVVVEQPGVRERRLGNSQKVVFGDLYFLGQHHRISLHPHSQEGERTL